MTLQRKSDRREEDKHWLIRVYRKFEPYIQIGGLLATVIITGATLFSLSEKALAFDGRVSKLERDKAELLHSVDMLNQKTDLMLQFFRIPNKVNDDLQP